MQNPNLRTKDTIKRQEKKSESRPSDLVNDDRLGTLLFDFRESQLQNAVLEFGGRLLETDLLTVLGGGDFLLALKLAKLPIALQQDFVQSFVIEVHKFGGTQSGAGVIEIPSIGIVRDGNGFLIGGGQGDVDFVIGLGGVNIDLRTDGLGFVGVGAGGTFAMTALVMGPSAWMTVPGAVVTGATVMESAAVGTTRAASASGSTGAAFAVAATFAVGGGGVINDRVDKFEEVGVRRSVSVKSVCHFRVVVRVKEVGGDFRVWFLKRSVRLGSESTGEGRGFIYLSHGVEGF
jgi:hypothetical protein